MKVITVNVNKGGAGKTTLSYNLAEYLRQNNRVLLIDLDDSVNLTNRYGNFNNFGNTIINLFEKGYVEPINVKDNLDLIAGHKAVELMKESLNKRRRREYIFGAWLQKHEDELTEKYDYIIVDTENDEGLLTINAIIASDLVIGVSEPSKDSFLALMSLRKFVDDLNDEFEGNTQLLYIANKVDFRTNSSKDLLEDLSEYSEYIGYIPERTSLQETEPIFNPIVHADKSDIKHLSELFSNVQNLVDVLEVG